MGMTDAASSFALLKRLLKTYLPRHKGRLSVAMVAMLVVSACMSLSAYYIQPLFDAGLIGQKIGVLNSIVAALLGLTVIKGIAYYLQGYYMEYIGQRLIADFQQDLYAKLVKQDLAFFQEHPTATLTSRFISDLLRLKTCVTQIFSSGLRDTAIIIGLLANMLYQDWKLTLASMVVLPFTAVIIKKTGRLSRKYAQLNQESTGRLAQLVSETLGHIRQVQSFTQEEKEKNRVNSAVDEVFYTSAKAGQVRALSSPLVELVGTVVIGLMMVYAGWEIRAGHLTPGAFASYIASLVIIIRPIKGLTSLNHILQEGLAAAQRTYAVMDAPVLVKNKPNAKALDVQKGEIVFEKVTLTYPDGTTALNTLSFTVPAGKTVALVGASGAGKSTALNLIPRFFDASSGQVKIDGVDVTEVELNSLRQHIALVSQDVAIFDDTVAANIAYGNPHATEKEIIKAAKMAAAHTFIENLPQGYDTVLGEDGVKISGGQKQRIAIARAMIKNAPILLLDEATSNLDTESERKVQLALEALMKGRTTLVVAHRLSTITNADAIYVLDQGQIVEQGTHTQLLKKRGVYAGLWRLQSGE